uniref:Putative vacuolar sorting protein vps33/slp1 sec1 family n=1 Tax=Ixodes ricinus TaxID=34613 RepID=A0A131Y2P4_IXORI
MARYGSDPGAVLQELLKAASGELLINTLKSIDGAKDLVIEPDLIHPMDQVASVGRIKSQGGVDKIYKLEARGPSCPSGRCVYLVRATVPNVKLIADHVSLDKQRQRHCAYHIVCIPRAVPVCEQVLESEGVLGSVQLLDLPLGLIPLDTDLFSLELPGFFPKFFLEGDCSWNFLVAQSILQLEQLCGPIAEVYGQGACAQGVLRLMKLFPSNPAKVQQTSLPRITHLFLFDRDVDYASVLLTQLTYSGLLDEFFGIKSGKVTFGKAVTGKDQDVRLPVNSSDVVFRDIRDCHFSSVFALLKDKAQHLQARYDERHGMSIGDMKRFVANELKSLQQQHNSLALYIGSCEAIKSSQTNFEGQLRTEHNLLEGLEVREGTNFIEECIHRQYPALSVLRLLCLLSLTQDGIPARELRSLTQQFLHSFGAHHLCTFHGLRRLGLCQEQGGGAPGGPAPSPLGVGSPAPTLASKVAAAMAALPRGTRFNAITKRLNLIPADAGDNYDLRSPKDPGYVFSGAYVPIACRLVEQIMQREGIHGYEDALKLLPGPTSTFTLPQSRGASREPPGLVLVYFLGGVTFAEVSALRLLARLKGYQVLVAATATVNGNTLLESVIPKEH